MLKTHLVLLVIWHLKLCADKIIQLLLIILLLVLWLLNACLEKDHIRENQEKKSVIIFYRSKYKLRREIFQLHHMNGLSRLQILLIRWCKGNLIIDWDTMDLKKLKITHGFVIFLGKISMRGRLELHLFHLWKIILTKKILARNGKMLMIQNLKKTSLISGKTRHKHNLMDTTSITSLPH
jgi:hypothetical protein